MGRKWIEVKRQDIIIEAKEWLGTKWQHQASLKQVACDCVGLVRGVYRELTGIDVNIAIDYPASWHLFKKEERLYDEAKRHMVEITKDEVRPGDVLVFGFYDHPASHVGILTSHDTFIHSYQDIVVVVVLIPHTVLVLVASSAHPVQAYIEIALPFL